MKLRTKLIITFLLLILVPVLFTGLALFGFGQHQINSIKQLYGVENPTYETLSDTTGMLNRVTMGTYLSMQQKAAEDPDAFEDEGYLNTLNLELETRYSFLVVRKGSSYSYCGREASPPAGLRGLRYVPGCGHLYGRRGPGPGEAA